MIDITLLGTAALVPLPERALTAAVLECGKGTVLFDCGEGTQAAARKARISLMKTDLIALTHYHGDHIFGLPGLLQTMCSMGREQPLYITGPEGLREELSPIITLAGWLSFELKLIETPSDGFVMSELIEGFPPNSKLFSFKTEHRVSSQGYCFTLGRTGKFQPQKAKSLGIPVEQWGKLQRGEAVQVGDILVTPQEVLGEPRKGLKFVFSGDTSPCGALETAARDADLLISEATYGENSQEPQARERGHMTFAQAARLAEKANVKRLWLAHYSQIIENPEDYLQNALEYFPNTVCGKDGMSVTLKFTNDKMAFTNRKEGTMKFTIKPLEGVEYNGVLITLGAPKSTVTAALGEPEGVYRKSIYYFKNELRIDFDENERIRFIEFLGGADGRLRPWIFGVSVFDTDADELTALLAEHNNEAPVDNENGHCLVFRNIGVGVYRDVIADRWSTIGIGSKDYYV